MMKRLTLILTAFFSIYASAQTVVVKDTVCLTYAFSDPDPVLQTDKIFPYHKFEKFALEPASRTYRMVVLENDYANRVLAVDAYDAHANYLNAQAASTGRTAQAAEYMEKVSGHDKDGYWQKCFDVAVKKEGKGYPAVMPMLSDMYASADKRLF